MTQRLEATPNNKLYLSIDNLLHIASYIIIKGNIIIIKGNIIIHNNSSIITNGYYEHKPIEE